MSEEMVVRQCAPTLAGIKAGSLFPCPCTDRDALLDLSLIHISEPTRPY